MSAPRAGAFLRDPYVGAFAALSPPDTNPRAHNSDVFRLAIWFGILSGLVEGTALYILQESDLLNWNIARVGVNVRIVWISAGFNLMLCLAIALVLIFLGRIFSRLPLLQVAVACFAFFLLIDWLMLSGRIQRSGGLVLTVGLVVTLLRWLRRRPESALLFFRRSLAWVVAAFLLVVIGIEGGMWWREQRAIANLPPAQSGAPNVLVIVVDTLRADHLGAYGYSRPTSPNIDKLGREGVLFENTIATSSWTLPSHASMLTGRYPHEHGAVKTKLPAGSPVLGEFLNERGYLTAAISANTVFFTERRGLGRGFVHFEDFFGSLGDMFARTWYGRKIQKHVLVPAGFEDEPGRKRAEDVTGAALGWIGKSMDRPFFLFLNYYDPHDPYLPPQPYRSKFSKRASPGGKVNNLLDRYYPTLTPEELQDELDAYDGSIAYADHYIGELISALERRGILANTLVVLAADHGESFGEHGLMTHFNGLYLETLHVPMIFRWPGHLPADTRVTAPVSIASLPATLLDLLGEGSQKEFPGPSLVRLWQDPSAPLPEQYLLAELATCHHWAVKPNPCYSGELKSLISPDWHYVVHERLGEEVYDWDNDRKELNNLVGTPAGRAAADDLGRSLTRLLASTRGSRVQKKNRTY